MGTRTILSPGRLVNLVLLDKGLDIGTITDYVNNFSLLIKNGQNDPTVLQHGTIETWIEKKSQSRDLFMMIQEKETEEIIGIIEITDLDTWNRRGELAITIFDEKKHKRGYGKESVKLMLDICFNTYNMNKIYIKTLAETSSAHHMFSKLQFRTVGLMKSDRFIYGKYEDTIIMEILASDWIKS